MTKVFKTDAQPYKIAYERLNASQKQAVDAIDGPVLVIAGPGTGKTQLLSVRVAHILQQTDTLPQNILCLTFTENGAANMSERLTRFIGQAAYDVNIGTYHSFGGDLIRRFPEVFAETRLQAPADELTKRQILREIVESLSYSNPLKQVRHHLGDLMSTISEVKRGLLDADGLRAIAAENAAFITAAQQPIQDIFRDFPHTARKLDVVAPYYHKLHEALLPLVPKLPVNAHFLPLGRIATDTLREALESAANIGKATPFTKWKNTWLVKNDDNQFVFSGTLETARIEALADVFERYQEALALNGWYDFDDMILRAIQALETHPDLRYTLHEQYQYILLDEFQDTNAAQLRLVQLLTDNPVHEGRPNILAVGDDDQAIYAFQGAQYSNMLDFHQMYRDVQVVHLTENYRSSADILTTARNISTQIDARLETHFPDMDKTLHAANPKLPARAELDRHAFASDVAQYDWIAKRIKTLIEQGIAPSEIAVLAPKHKQLEPLVPYLAQLEVPMRYEKRENILEAPVIRQLIAMSKLVIALHDQNDAASNALWPEVLSFDFWAIPTSDIWQLSWEVHDTPGGGKLHWSKALLDSDKSHFREPALLMLALAGRLATETCEQMLDYLIGTEPVVTNDPDTPEVRSPLRAFYTGSEVQHSQPELFYDTISHLTVLRAKLRDFAATQVEALTLGDLIRFIDMYEAAEERMLNTSPYNQQADAVQLMTVFKAKGLEYQHVFLPSCQDEVWGSSSRGNSNKLTLPVNLAPIRHAGATDDERLRILFVAITRAKLGLHMTSFTKTYTGKQTKHLKYLDEQEQEDGTFKALVLPDHVQAVQENDHTAPTLASLELNWRHRHVAAADSVDLKSLLAQRLERYQLSPTHLTRFIDLEYGGPEAFFFDTLLRFPSAPTVNSQFGNAIHTTLEWVQHKVSEQGAMPATSDTVAYFSAHLKRCKLTEQQYTLEYERGKKALTTYLTHRSHIYTPTDRAEHNFRNENVFVGEAHLAGKVDRMEIDPKAKTITVIDYKTGHSYSKWSTEARLHKYQLQLYCYKLLIEGSRTFRGYQVTAGRLEFIEPDADGKIHALELNFSAEKLEHVRKLLQAMWHRVHALDLPDIQSYSKTTAGIKQFEDDLLA